MAAINLDVGANTRRAERDIQKLVNKSYNINLKTRGDQPLGRITGKVNEFTKSLDASNARVIAFGASAGIIFGIQRAFEALGRSVIDVQKSLQDINVILNVSTSQLQKFGGELFNIARNTGQSFNAVAQAATEFSRQGLGLEETLKRTSNALILSRLSGLDAAKSVEALTAAVNSFASQAVTTTEIVNKFANVDAAFAVSSADLAEAISRVGSSASQSGVSLNELIAIVTSAQQTTARGGAVIGNSFKTIFTRLQRTDVVNLLDSLGVNTKDSAGQIKSTINLLTDLAKVYDQLGTLQQSEVAEKVGGVFQINILKAALADLGKEYSVYNNALNVAASSTDQAIRRNQELNKTYAAQLNALQENARQLGANVGERLFGPSFDRVVGSTNKLLSGVNESDGQDAGSVLAKGVLDGLGQVLAGPGLALIGGIIIKLFKDLSKFATGSLQQLLGLNNASGQQRDLQQSISQILAKNPQLIDLALKGEQGLNAAANQLLSNLQKQTSELQKQATVAAQISKIFYGAGVRVQGGVPTVPTPGKAGKASGYIPSFAKLQPGVSPEDAMGEVLTAKKVGYEVKPEEVYKRRIHKGDGSSMMATVSEAETVFDKTIEGKKGTWVIPPTGFAKGYVPNFKKGDKGEKFTNFGGKYAYLIPFGVDAPPTLPTQKIGKFKVGGIPIRQPDPSQIDSKADKDSANLYKNIQKVIVDEAFKYTNVIRPLNKSVTRDSVESKFETTAGAAGALKGAAGSAFEVGIISALDYQSASRRGDAPGNFDVRGGANLQNIQKLFNLPGTVGLADFKINADSGNIKKFYEKVRKEESVGAFDDTEKIRNINRDAEIEVARELLKDPQLEKWVVGNNEISKRAPDFIKKMVEDRKRLIRPRYNLSGFPKGPVAAASGYIPNFSALQDAIGRERAAGVSSNKIYVAQDGRLASGYNPLGLGVFNTGDEPTAASRSRAIRDRGFANGYIPNFAEDVTSAGIGQTVTALIAELGILAFVLKDFSSDVRSSQESIITSANAQLDADRARLSEVKKGTPEYEKLNRSITKTDQYLKGTGPKIDAWASSVSNALIFAGPIIAQTIKNAIGQETKGARVAGSAVESAGNALSAGAFAATLLPKGKTKGGLAVAAIVALFSALTGPLKEFGTDLPELSKAAKDASEKLSSFGNISQTVQTTFEQIQDLASKGQVQEAGKVQQSLIADTISQITDPNVQAKVITAVENKDIAALKKALEENTKKLQESNDIASRKENVEAGIQNLKNLQPGISDALNFAFQSSQDLAKKREERTKKQTEAARPIFSKTLTDITAASGVSATEKVDTLSKLRSEVTASLEGYKNVLKQRGFSEEEIAKLAADEALTRPALIALINEQIDVQRNIINNTGQGNKVIAAINKALDGVRENYSKYSQAISEGTAAFVTSKYQIQNALGRIAANATQVASDISESFFGENAVFAQDFQQKSTQAGLAKIDSDAQSNIRTPVADALLSVIDIIKGSADKKFSDAATIGDNQAEAEKNFTALPGVIDEISKSFDIGSLQSLLQIPLDKQGNFDIENFKGFDTESIVATLQKQFGDNNDKIKEVTTKLQEANRTLLEQKRIQAEQRVLLAQQKFSEIAKAFVNAVKTSFGGFEGFVSDNFEFFDKFEEAAAGLRILGKPGESPESQIEFGRELGSVISELSKIAGRPIAPQLEGGADNPVLQNIIKGQALSIQENLDNIFSDLSNFEGSQDIADAFRKTLTDQLNLGANASNEEIAVRTAEAQTNAALATGGVNENILEGARKQFEKSNPELAKYLNDANAAFMDSETLSKIQLERANDFLSQIAENTKKGKEDVENTKDSQPAQPEPPAQPVDGAARGYIPRFAAGISGSSIMANDAEYLVKNARREIQDARKMYPQYNPKPTMVNGFNYKKDAILTPIQKQIFDQLGMFSNAKPIGRAATGSIPGSLNTLREITDAYLLDWKASSDPRLPVPKPGSFMPKWAEFGANSVLPENHPAMQMGAQTNVAKAVEEAGKQIPKAAAQSNLPIKPSQLGGAKDTFRSGFKRVTDTSSYVDELTKASQAEVAALRGVGETVAEAQTGTVSKTVADTVSTAQSSVAKASKFSVIKKLAGKALIPLQVGGFVSENYSNITDPERIAEFNKTLSEMPWYARAVAGLTNPMTSISGASLAIQEALGGDPTGRLAKSKAGQGKVIVNGQEMTLDEFEAFQKQQQQKAPVPQKPRSEEEIIKKLQEYGNIDPEHLQKILPDIKKYEDLRVPLETQLKNKFFTLFPGAGPRPATKDDIDMLYKRGKYAPKPVAPTPISDNGIIKKYKTPEEAQLASRMAREKNANKMSPEQQDFFRQSDFQDELAKKIGGIVTGGSEEEVMTYLREKAKSVGMEDRFVKDYLEPEMRKKQRIAERQKTVAAQQAKREDLQRNLDWIYKDNPKGKEEFLKKFGYNNTSKTRGQPVQSRTNPYKLIGGKGNKPATQINTRTGVGDYVPKATLPDQIIKRETGPKSQEELRKLMPPQYFQRLGKNYVDQIMDAYNEQIKNTKDQGKAMALRKRADAIRSLYDQGIDSRTTDMDKFNELENIYKSMQKTPMSFEDYQKTPEYRNRILSKNAANGYLPMAGLSSIMEENRGGVPFSEMTAVQRPEVQGINNINGVALMERNEVNKERLALGARGYIPNFAGALNKESTKVNLGGVNVNIATSKNNDYSALGPQIEELLNSHVPSMIERIEKLNNHVEDFQRTKERVDNMAKIPGSAASKAAPPPKTRQKTSVK